MYPPVDLISIAESMQTSTNCEPTGQVDNAATIGSDPSGEKEPGGAQQLATL
jgi:hypothetical protein